MNGFMSDVESPSIYKCKHVFSRGGHAGVRIEGPT